MNKNIYQPKIQPTYRADIDGLRAIAVLSVVGFHAFPQWIRGGFIGVDIFFVISGYLISRIIYAEINNDNFHLSRFYARRIKRIFPALILVLFTCYVFGWFTLLPTDFGQLGKEITAGAGFIANIFFWSEAGYFDVSADRKPLLHLWSLGIEEQFYILWPGLLILISRQKSRFTKALFFITFVSFAINVLGVMRYPNATFYFPITRFWELLIGSILAWLQSSNNLNVTSKASINNFLNADLSKVIESNLYSFYSNIASVLGLLILVYGFCVINKDLNYPGMWALFPVIGTALIIAAGSGAFLNKTLLSNKILVWIGLISYPLYLWHYPLLFFLGKFSDNSNYGMRAFTVAISILLAWITMRYIESPIRFGNVMKVRTLCILLATIAVIGYATYLNGGVTSRYSTSPDMLVKSIDFHWSDHVQFEKCHLQSPEKITHDESCLQDGRPLVALWGDSHASSIYPGLNALQSNRRFSIFHSK